MQTNTFFQFFSTEDVISQIMDSPRQAKQSPSSSFETPEDEDDDAQILTLPLNFFIGFDVLSLDFAIIVSR
jgi:hypothetical protein